MIHYKNKEEQAGMRAAGKLAAATLMMLNDFVKAGVATRELDILVRDFTFDNGAEAATLGYGSPPFPAHCCISVNQIACHGVPNGYILKDGDVVNIDVTPKLNGWHGDTSKMYLIGDVSKEDKELCKVAHGALWAGIAALEVGEDINVIGNAIAKYMSDKPQTLVRHYCGHGTGLVFHDEPQILHYEFPVTGTIIEPGMTFTIEPIINQGVANTAVSNQDNWTVFTLDKKNSAQWEHTLLVTDDDDIEILTLREEEL
jgi:methionyl aminopeptidase